MEVKIGVTHAPRELVVDTELDTAAIEELVRTALEDGGVLALSDIKGRKVVVPGTKLAYVEISHSVTGQVGFLKK